MHTHITCFAQGYGIELFVTSKYPDMTIIVHFPGRTISGDCKASEPGLEDYLNQYLLYHDDEEHIKPVRVVVRFWDNLIAHLNEAINA